MQKPDRHQLLPFAPYQIVSKPLKVMPGPARYNRLPTNVSGGIVSTQTNFGT